MCSKKEVSTPPGLTFADSLPFSKKKQGVPAKVGPRAAKDVHHLDGAGHLTICDLENHRV